MNTDSQNPRSGKLYFGPSYNPWNLGDIVKFTVTRNGVDYVYYAALLSGILNPYNYPDTYNVSFLGNMPVSADINVSSQAYETKNPPYTKDFYDIWGNFKSDYTGAAGKENIDREATDLSQKNLDVWSLRSIQTSLGATVTIDYEADSYWSSEYAPKRVFNIDPSVGYTLNGQNTITTASYFDRINVNEGGNYQFAITEPVATGIVTGQTIKVETIAALTPECGTSCSTGTIYEAGGDNFTVTSVSVNSSTNKTTITGVFELDGAKNNPLWKNYSCEYILQHLGSYLILQKPDIDQTLQKFVR